MHNWSLNVSSKQGSKVMELLQAAIKSVKQNLLLLFLDRVRVGMQSVKNKNW